MKVEEIIQKIKNYGTKSSNHDRILFFLCVFCTLYSFFFISIYEYPILGDERTYYAYGKSLYNGNGYSYQEVAPFRQSNLREPAYPFFIFLLFKIFGVSKEVVQIAQAILNGIIVQVTYRLANLIFKNRRIALTAAFLIAVSPTVAGYAALIASETLATAYLVLMLLSFILFLKKHKSPRAILFLSLAGLFCGCLALTKMVYFPFFLLICIALSLMPADRFIKCIRVLSIAIIFILILSPWLLFNKKLYGNYFFLTNRGGMALTVKAQRLHWTPKEIIVSFIYPLSEGLIKKYLPDEYRRVTGNPVDGSVFKIAYDKYDLLISRGYSEIAADKQLRTEALSKIKGHFLKYIILSISDFHYMLYFEGLPLSQFTDFFKRDTRFVINAFFKFYSLLIIFFAVKGIFVMFRKRENIIIKIVFLLPIGYTLLMYSAFFGAPRFTFTIIPFIYILASLGIYGLTKAKTAL